MTIQTTLEHIPRCFCFNEYHIEHIFLSKHLSLGVKPKKIPMTSLALPMFYVPLIKWAELTACTPASTCEHACVASEGSVVAAVSMATAPTGKALNNESGRFESEPKKKKRKKKTGHRSDTDDGALEIYLPPKHPLLSAESFSTWLNSAVRSQQTFSSVLRVQSRFCCAANGGFHIKFINPWCHQECCEKPKMKCLKRRLSAQVIAHRKMK